MVGAFSPVPALVRHGLVPPAEAREALRGKVASTLFYAEPILFLAKDAAARLDALQEEYERTLLGAGPWNPPGAAVRAEMGAMLPWGEELMYRVICFRAEVLALPEEM